MSFTIFSDKLFFEKKAFFFFVLNILMSLKALVKSQNTQATKDLSMKLLQKQTLILVIFDDFGKKF